MWKKVVSGRIGRNIMAAFLMLMLFNLFGCTTGVKKDPGLTDYEAPNIPQNITGVGKERAILINWTANTEPDLVGYRVYRSNNSGGPFTLISTVGTQPAPSYLDDDQQNGLVNDQYYFYKVSAFDTQGKESDLSRTNAVQIRAGLPPEERPPRVVNLKARTSRSAAYVSWDKVTSSHIKGYHIYRGLSTTAGGVQWISSVPQNTPGFVDTAVTSSSAEQYTYIVRSFNENHTESENSDPVQVTIKSGDDTIPTAPYDLSISNDTNPVLTWHKPTKNEDGSNIFDGTNPTMDIESYLIFRASSNDALFSLIGIVEDNGSANMTQTFTDVNGTPYNLYAVRTLDNNGNVSELSSVTTQSSDADIPAVPTGLKAWSSSATEAGIRLAWNSSKNATSYNLYFSTVADGGYTKMLTSQPQWNETSPYVVNAYPSSFNQNPDKKGKKLEFGVPYFFKVSAVSASGKESGLSSYAKAYPGGMFVAMLEGENPNWAFDDAANDGQFHFYIAQSSKEYPNIDYYSGAGAALLVPSTTGTPGNGDAFQYGTGDSNAVNYFALPSPTSGAYRYNVYAYYFPHTSSGNWRIQIRENGIGFNNYLLAKDLNGYSAINKGRTAVGLGQIQINAGMRGVDVECFAVNAGAGGAATLFLDSLVFVRVQ